MQKQRYFASFALVLLASIFIIGGCSTLPTEKFEYDDYPKNPINLIVPFSAGGGTDLQARALEKMFVKHLNQKILVINKPGGGGTIGWNELVQATPDGYTLGMTATELLMQPLYGQTKYHYPTAVEPIAQIVSTPFLLVVNSDQSWDTLEQFIEYGKDNPGQLKYGHGGVGSITQALAASFSVMAGISTEQVPFQGGGETLSALLGNHIQFAFADPSVVKEQLKAGKVKALAITSDERSVDRELKDIPTFKESGIDLSLSVWTGIAAPKEVPEEIRQKLSSALEEMTSDPEFQATMKTLGVQIDYLNAADSKEKWVKEIDSLSRMIKDTGIDRQIREQKK